MLRWDDLTPLQKAQFGNGCGPAFFPEYLTQFLFGWFFDASCRRHDFAYARGGSRSDRKADDIGFYKAMLRDAILATRGNGFKERGLCAVAWVFYKLVRGFGWLRFSYGPYKTHADLFGFEAVG
ncbi:MAG: hypothetical protein JKY51_00715 [Opitutaceae bacterium]|nr:hypothetical protein [Opitutaceae bacterium]